MRLKRIISKTVIVSLFILLSSVNGHSYIRNNGAGGGYDGSGGESSNGKNMIIESYIIETAGYFLKAHMDIQGVLRIVELQDTQGIDFNQLNNLVENALQNMQNAKETCEKLTREAETTPYNPIVISRLMNFDYDAFMEDYRLNPAIFKEVEGYLKKGDITGVFKRDRVVFAEIIEMLTILKIEVNRQCLPGLSLFWRLNETLSASSISGSYMARIFQAIN